MSEEDWQRRLQKRLNAVAHIERTPDYLECKARGYHVPAPDPQDLSVSKRQWERSVQLWRRALQELARQ